MTDLLPADNHVHSEWSWDAVGRGDMVGTCARAVELGLPSIAFTEHVDHTARSAPFDADGYLAAIEECRSRFPDLRILTGVEVGEAHWDPADTTALLAGGRFERVLASVHSTEEIEGHPDLMVLYGDRAAEAVVRGFLEETARLIKEFDGFEVLAHIDYPFRKYPGTYDIRAFEEEYRHVLGLLAGTGKALEYNTRRPMEQVVLEWWREAGGEAVSFASDAHVPDKLAHGFREATKVARAAGFRPGRDPLDLWRRD